jgi:TDG/mug DNA glycosylase family protein
MTALSDQNKYTSEILKSGLGVVFCGINPSISAIKSGFNFSHPSNRFWAVLYQAGFTSKQLRPQDQRSLLDYGYGISVAVERPTKTAAEISKAEFLQALGHFEDKMLIAKPRYLAFLGKPAVSSFLGKKEISWGLQTISIANARVWVLPNPSGLNKSFSLEKLVMAYSDLHVATQNKN